MGNSKSKTADIDITDDENQTVNIIVNRPNGVINKDYCDSSYHNS